MLHPHELVDFGSPPGSAFGSPAFEGQLGMSPPFRSALDAPLPPTFSSQDQPNIQKFGQHAMSVPAKGGLGPLINNSPTSSNANHESFSNLDSALNEKLDLGSSPPETRAEVAPRRILPTGRSLRSSEFPSSMPIRDREDILRTLERRQQLEFENHEEDFLPQSLSDLLTPQEKMRRFSRSQDDPSMTGRPSHSSLVSSPNSKFGSPTGASPSRFSGFFAEQAKREAEAANPRIGSSPFGHVGSPLRNSTISANARDLGGHSPSFGPISPPGSKDRPGGVSRLSEQLRVARHPLPVDAVNQPPASSLSAATSTPRGFGPGSNIVRRERVFSTGSGTASDRHEEEDSCFFSIEDMEDDDMIRKRKEASARSSLSNDV